MSRTHSCKDLRKEDIGKQNHLLAPNEREIATKKSQTKTVLNALKGHCWRILSIRKRHDRRDKNGLFPYIFHTTTGWA
jgi:hypothetical protein